MIPRIPLSRAVARAATLALGVAVPLLYACAAEGFTPAHKASSGGEATPLNLGGSTAASHASSSSGGGGSIVRTIVGLLIVIAVIWGLSWILRQVKSGRETRAAGSGLASIATLPLGSNRALHLVRAGSDYLLLGSAEQGVVPIQRYSEQQAREAGLFEEPVAVPEEEQPPLSGPGAGTPTAGGRAGRGPHRIEMPGAGGNPARDLLDRLREWTVRR